MAYVGSCVDDRSPAGASLMELALQHTWDGGRGLRVFQRGLS